jgi:hypothetical protein
VKPRRCAKGIDVTSRFVEWNALHQKSRMDASTVNS